VDTTTSGGAGVRTVRRDALLLGLTVGAYGAAFGAAGVAAGLTVAQCCALSLIAFTGASQFAVAGVLGAGGSPLAALGGAWLLGARNTLYGLRLSGLLGFTGWRRPLVAHGVIDETTAMALPQPDRRRARVAFVTTFVSLYAMWNVTTLLGALAATGLGPTARAALDGMVPAAFLALLWPRLREGRQVRAVAASGALLALATTPFLPPGVPVLVAVVAVALARPWRGPKEGAR
jgi:predicted branched-subunit amino acid permease